MNIRLKFHGILADFFLPKQRDSVLCLSLQGNPTLKHLIESVGIPHTEVMRILVNDHHAGLTDRVQDADSIEVFPVTHSEALSIEPRFILDNHLGKLAIYLRILGFDASYRNDIQDDEIIRLMSQEGRILLTRDRHLLMRRIVVQGYCIRSLDPGLQVSEVVRRFDLYHQIKPFQRCLRCNTSLETISKNEILERLEPLTRMYYDEFRICPNCNRIYWKGSHYERMLNLVTGILGLEDELKPDDQHREESLPAK